VSDPRDDEFYVGYLPAAPARLGRWLRPRVLGLWFAGLALAMALAVAQAPFARATFEFGELTTLTGTLFEGPVPHLEVERPGGGRSSYLLVSFGKHGAAQAVRGHDGKSVEITGSLVHRDGRTMIELAPDGLRELGQGNGSSAAWDGVERTLRGEIVDSKCFLGVMKPGHLKTHRACAVRCISGGVPPVLLVRDAAGNASYYLLVARDGGPVNAQVLPFVAEAIEVRGELGGYPGQPVLRIDPAQIRRLP
jgi:hypothetical protein